MPDKNSSPPEVKVYELCARITSLEEKLLSAIAIINNSQTTMSVDVSKIKEAVYNPDKGLYARLHSFCYGRHRWRICDQSPSVVVYPTTKTLIKQSS